MEHLSGQSAYWWAGRRVRVGIAGINALAIDAVNPDLLYVFLWEKGIYKSEDGGVTWQSANKPMPQNAVIKLMAYGGAVAAMIQETESRDRSLHISLDAGRSWHLLTEFTMEDYGMVNDVAFMGSASGTELTLLVATDSGVYASPIAPDWKWRKLIDLPFISWLAVGDELEDGFYFTATGEQNESRLYFWQTDLGLQEGTAIEQGVRSLAASLNPDSSLTAYLLLGSEEVISVEQTGKRQSLGRAPASLLDDESVFAFRNCRLS